MKLAVLSPRKLWNVVEYTKSTPKQMKFIKKEGYLQDTITWVSRLDEGDAVSVSELVLSGRKKASGTGNWRE